MRTRLIHPRGSGRRPKGRSRALALGAACFLAGLVIGAGASRVGGDDQTAPTLRSGGEYDVDVDEADRGGHVLVFLVEGVSDVERQAIEAAVAAQEHVEAYEYWNAEATRAEARRLFRDDRDMLAKLDEGVHVPESYRLLLREPNRPNAMIVSSRLEGLAGVLEVVISGTVPSLGE